MPTRTPETACSTEIPALPVADLARAVIVAGFGEPCGSARSLDPG